MKGFQKVAAENLFFKIKDEFTESAKVDRLWGRRKDGYYTGDSGKK